MTGPTDSGPVAAAATTSTSTTTVTAVPGPDAPVELLRVPWSDTRAVELRAAMDAEISPRYSDRFDGRDAEEAQRLAASFAIRPEDIVSTFIATVDGVPAAHAALRALGDEWELKRLVTLPAYRGRGLSQALIAAVESDVLARGGTRLILQTGDRQPEAVSLYLKLGFERIPIFAPYTVFAGSHCFSRELSGV